MKKGKWNHCAQGHWLKKVGFRISPSQGYKICKACEYNRMRRYYLKHRKKVAKLHHRKMMRHKRSFLRGKICVVCGSNRNRIISGKPLDINFSYSEAEINKRMAGTTIYCRKHYLEKEAKIRYKPLVHGTFAGYRTRGCRCRLCRDAYNAYNRMTRRRRDPFVGLKKRGAMFRDPEKKRQYALELLGKIHMNFNANPKDNNK